MRYEQWTFHTADVPVREMLTAWLAEAGFEGFEEEADALRAYAPEGTPDRARIAELAAIWEVPYEQGFIEPQNWNKQWEESFEPVVIPGFVTVRAHFHPPASGATPHEVVITPQMSFGTGHHATTRLVMSAMRDLAVEGRRILDFGTGTGVLAILAAQLGAACVVAVDNDEWSVKNATDNVTRNSVENIVEVRAGRLEAAGEAPFDGALANINRNILLAHAADLRRLLRPGGWCVMSGILVEDVPAVVEAAQSAGWTYMQQSGEEKWAAVVFG